MLNLLFPRPAEGSTITALPPQEKNPDTFKNKSFGTPLFKGKHAMGNIVHRPFALAKVAPSGQDDEKG